MPILTSIKNYGNPFRRHSSMNFKELVIENKMTLNMKIMMKVAYATWIK